MLRDPPQPPQHLRDVGPEDAAVAVALVDRRRTAAACRERRPPRVRRAAARDAAMSGLVRTTSACRRAQSRSSIGVSPSYVAARTSIESELADRTQLVGGQRLRRREVEVVPAPVQRRGQRRQQVGERLAGCGAGRDHHRLDPTRPGRRPAPGGSTARRRRAPEGRRRASGSTQSGHVAQTVRPGPAAARRG